MIHLGLWVIESRPERQTAILSQLIKGTFDQHDLLLLMLTLITWLRQYLSDFSSVKSFFYFHLLCALEGGHYVESIFQKPGFTFHLLEGGVSYINNLKFFCTRNLFLPKSYLGEVSKQQAFLQDALSSFHWRMILDTKIPTLDVLAHCYWVSFLLCPLRQ